MNSSTGSPVASLVGTLLGAVAGAFVLILGGAVTGAVLALLLGGGVSACSLFGMILGGFAGVAGGAIGGWQGVTTGNPSGRSALVPTIIVCLVTAFLLGGWVSPLEKTFLIACMAIGMQVSRSVAATVSRTLIRDYAPGDRHGAKPPTLDDDLGP